MYPLLYALAVTVATVFMPAATASAAHGTASDVTPAPDIEVTFVPYESDEQPGQIDILGTDSRDRIDVGQGDVDDDIVVRSVGDTVVTTTSPECAQVDEYTVNCSSDHVRWLSAQLGAGDDSFQQFTSFLIDIEYVGAGPGDDFLRANRLITSADGYVKFAGGGGADRLIDNTPDFDPDSAPAVAFYAGPGNDRLFNGSFMSGEGGADRINAMGVRPESTVYGGAGADLLLSSYGDDTMHGDGGADRIRDGGGDDVIYGGQGSDRVNVDDGGRDDVACGGDRDIVQRDWRDHTVRCEVTRR